MASEIVLQLVVNDEIADGCNYAACAVEIVPELDADYCSHSRLNLFLSQVLRIPDICHFFYKAKFLENKIYTKNA